MIVRGYLEEAFNVAFVFAIIYVIIRIFYMKKHNGEFYLKKEILNIMIVSYFAALCSQTIMPIIHSGFCNGKFYLNIYTYNSLGFNFIPFKSIKMYFSFKGDQIIKNGEDMRLLNFFSNIGLFIPFGLLIPIKFPKMNFWKLVLSAASCSIFIEIMQIIVKRAVDIDDFILNTFGAIVGFVFLKLTLNLFFIINMRKVHT